MNAQNSSFRLFVLEQLAQIPDLRCRSMFGGHGLYAGEQFFGIIHDDRLYFRTTVQTRADYVAAGMTFFRPSPRQSLKSYYEVPAAILEDRERLDRWAGKAIRASD